MKLATGKYARVELIPDAADVIAASVGSVAALPYKGPGLSQDDAVQLVSKWAWRRDRFMRGAANDVKVALHNTKDQNFAGVWEGDLGKLGKLLTARPELQATLMVGDGPMAAPLPGGGELGDKWAIELARALDATTTDLAKVQQGGDIPFGFGSVSKLVAAPVVVGIIVGGAALAVIGTAAVWRYLDPELRAYVSGLNAAADAYDKRVQVFKATGKMPGPTPTEVSIAKQIKAQAAKETGQSLIYAGAIAGGLTLTAVGLAWVRGH